MHDELHQLASRTPQSGGSSDLGGSKRRSVGERRLHLRKTPSRDRSAQPLLINAAGERRGGGPEAAKKPDQVFFGASVTYASARGNVKTITIVGVDEADFSRGQVSWVSPVATALMKAQEGDVVEVRAPSGVEQIEALEIRYGGVRGETE